MALVQMPFAATTWPSLGLGLLKAALTRSGVPSRVIYLNTKFSDRVGVDAYQAMSDGAPDNTDLLAEWVFTRALWDDLATSDEVYFRNVVTGPEAARRKNLDEPKILEAWNKAFHCRESVEAFLEACLAEHDWAAHRIVGFTSVFQQHVASLALARRLKARYPHLQIIFGGANCEGPMGLATLRAFPFVDAVCIGEGDTAFPAYVADVLAGSAHAPTNIITRDALAALDRENEAPASEPTVDMDALPIPDFDEFFAEFEGRGADALRPLRLIFETSRGCWWGQKNHCTFCGLNGASMAFRYKSPERAITEIQSLLGRYGRFTEHFFASDNIIPFKYFDDFLPRVIELDMKLSLFYETKANLKKDQLVAYRDAGMVEIQPGIESLDTDILRIMRKGVSGIQNIQLLKWCKELGIYPFWNYLFGFPGERPDSYDEIAAEIGHLSHLDPPCASGQLRFDRFSPYVSTPDKFGIEDLSPYPAYRFIYPGLEEADIRQIAYYFTGSYENRDGVGVYTTNLQREIETWRREGSQSLLAHVDDGAEMLIFDTRPLDGPRTIALTGLFRKVMLWADGIITPAQMPTDDAEASGLTDVIARLRELGLICVEGERLLSLSVPLESVVTPAPEALTRMRELLIEDDGNDPARDGFVLNQSRVVKLEF